MRTGQQSVKFKKCDIDQTATIAPAIEGEAPAPLFCVPSSGQICESSGPSPHGTSVFAQVPEGHVQSTALLQSAHCAVPGR